MFKVGALRRERGGVTREGGREKERDGERRRGRENEWDGRNERTNKRTDDLTYE
jgi:hypothetical protein